MANRDYLNGPPPWASSPRRRRGAAAVFGNPAEIPARALGHGAMQPPDAERERIATYFDPLPIWYSLSKRPDLGADIPVLGRDPATSVHVPRWFAERLVAPDRTHTSCTCSVHCRAPGLHDDDWVDVDSHHGRITVPVRLAGNVHPIPSGPGTRSASASVAWRLSACAGIKQGFLLTTSFPTSRRRRLRQRDPVTARQHGSICACSSPRSIRPDSPAAVPAVGFAVADVRHCVTARLQKHNDLAAAAFPRKLGLVIDLDPAWAAMPARWPARSGTRRHDGPLTTRIRTGASPWCVVHRVTATSSKRRPNSRR